MKDAGRDGLGESDSAEKERVEVRSARALALTSSRAGIAKATVLVATEGAVTAREDSRPPVSSGHALADASAPESGGWTHQGDQERIVADILRSAFVAFSVSMAMTSVGWFIPAGKSAKCNFQSYLK